MIERGKGNRIFENAKKWGLSHNTRKRLLENAMASYVSAEILASDSDEYASALKNHAKAAWNLYCLLKEKEEHDVSLLMEASKFFCLAYEKGSSKRDEWREDLLTSLTLCTEEVHDVCRNINEVDEKCKILSSFFEVVTVKPAHVRLKMNLAKILFHHAVKLLQGEDFKGALKRARDCYRPIEEAKRLNQSDSCAAEIRVLEKDVHILTCSAESVQACKRGNELLTVATLEVDCINIDLVWDAIDWFKTASILTRDQDLEQEAIALSHLGFVYEKVLKLKYRSKEYYKKCLELVESMKPRTFLTQDWYQRCVSTLQELQMEERMRDEREKQKEREKKLEAVKEELKDLKKNNTGKCEFLIHVYNTYPPKNPKWEKPSEKENEKMEQNGNKRAEESFF